MRELPEEIEQHRDRKWRREESLRVETAADVETMVEDLGFCLGLTDVRKDLPSVYVAVCGRRDAHMPRNVQKDYEASKAWAKSVVLDLRGNGGGILEEGVRIASMFLERGALVASVTGKAGTVPSERRAQRNGRWEDLPLTVVVDARTASAAEIIAGALRHHNRAMLVGEPTYGKGLVQRVVALTPELSMRMTTARWMTPSGKSLERRQGTGIDAVGGIMPDVFVPDAARPEAMGTLPGLSGPTSARMLRLADTAAAIALREAWPTASLPVIESRLRARVDSLVGAMTGNPTGRAVLIGEATRLATVRVLEVSGKQDVVVRYQAIADHALRAALDVLMPGAHPFQVDTVVTPRNALKPVREKTVAAPADSVQR